ncbi:MAG: low-specificity L-threonine aldolase [Desulfobacterales bacterium]
MDTIDLRSDTITQPTPAMREAMANAVVGDDVFGEDPTVIQLEEMAAERMGKEAALFVASGTMANIISEMTHCGRGDEMILGARSHIFLYEQGGSAAIGGIHPRTIPNESDGTLNLDALTAALREDDDHFPVSRLIVLENTHNRCYGTPLDLTYMNAVGLLAHENGLKLHVDGARIFNAAIALSIDPAQLVASADSVAFCLSKGLAAPVGSMVCGNKEFVARARRARKILGGGMRQAGVIAAAGIVALNEMVDRLADDHANARALAEGLVDIRGVSADPNHVTTNIVYIDIEDSSTPSADLAEQLNAKGVRLLPTAPDQLRAVTNYHITPDDIQQTLDVFKEVLG